MQHAWGNISTAEMAAGRSAFCHASWPVSYLSRMLASSPASRTSLMSDSAAGNVSMTGRPELDGSATSMS